MSNKALAMQRTFVSMMAAVLLLSPGAGAVTIGNPRLRVSIEDRQGALTECTDLATGHRLLSSPSPLWELQLSDGGKLITIAPAEASRFRVEALPAGVRGYHLVWDGFSASAGTNLAVSVSVQLGDQDENSRWRLVLSGVDRDTLRQVRFPILRDLAPQTGERLAVPMWMGQLAPDPRKMLKAANGVAKRWQWHYPGELSLQCLALWGDQTGLYLACDDTDSFRKALAVTIDGEGGLGCEVVHWPESGSGTRWAMPYDVLLGTYAGDWFTAAERYRAWGTNQAWAVQSRLAKGAVPKWVSDTALWVWNRGRSGGVLEPAIELRRRLGLPVSVFWHWWHGCAYDTGFPEYLPPREGTDSFKRAVARAREHQVHALAYMNQRLWGMTTESWTNRGAATWAVKAEDGNIRPEVYNTFNRAPCASMCLGTDFWRDTYAGRAEEAVRGLGLSGIYMDQACLSLSCFDPGHGHPVGGGTYWVKGFRLLAEDLRHRCTAPALERGAARPGLAGEGCGEPWLTELDLMLSLQVSKERYAGPDGWEPIPFFHAVYHPYALLFGNYSSLTMPPYDELWPPQFAPKEPLKLLDPAYSTQFRLEQARGFVWGQQPTLANFLPAHVRARKAEIDYVLELARLRYRFGRYLQQGTLLRPPLLEVATARIPMSRLSIYAGQQGGLRVFEKEVPLALAAAWQAPDGRVAVAVASIVERNLSVGLSIPTRDYGIPPGARMRWVTQNGRDNIGKVSRTPEVTVELELAPSGIGILEFEKSDR